MISRKGKRYIVIGLIVFLFLPIVDVFLLDPFVLHTTVPGETLFGVVFVIVELILFYVLWRYFRLRKTMPEEKSGPGM